MVPVLVASTLCNAVEQGDVLAATLALELLDLLLERVDGCRRRGDILRANQRCSLPGFATGWGTGHGWRKCRPVSVCRGEQQSGLDQGRNPFFWRTRANVHFRATELRFRMSAPGRERQFANFECGRSVAILSRSPVDLSE